MAMTLAEMKVCMSDKVAEQVVDTFLRESEILQLLPFDNCVSPTGGSTLTYSYVQKKLPATAEFRAINSEYTTSQTTLESKTAIYQKHRPFTDWKKSRRYTTTEMPGMILSWKRAA